MVQLNEDILQWKTGGGKFMDADCETWIRIFDEKNKSIIKLELGEMVKRITAHEVDKNFHIEAVKALAVAIRTTIARNLSMFDGQGCCGNIEADVCTSMKGCDCISGMDLLKEALKDRFDECWSLAQRAVDDTKGMIIKCGGKPIKAEYHLACGGGTQNSEDVYGNSVMYFRKVLCNYCRGSLYYENIVDIPVKEIEDKLHVKCSNGSPVSGPKIEGMIDEIEREETGRVRKIKIGGKYFTGNEIKELLGLNSSRFGWDPLVLRFRVRGTGNGIGMCLYGADSMAREGRSYFDILKYYYTNIDIEKIDLVNDEKPLEGRIFVIDPGHGGVYSDEEKGLLGVRESEVNLYIAKKLRGYLEQSGAKAILTRTDDVEMSLPARVEMVNSIRPNFLISIHQNWFYTSGISGTEAFFYRGDKDGENMSRMIVDNIVKSLGTVNRGSKYADLYLLRESKISSVVVECMYLSNPLEEKKLSDEKVKDEIARAIYQGIMDYYGLEPKKHK